MAGVSSTQGTVSRARRNIGGGAAAVLCVLAAGCASSSGLIRHSTSATVAVTDALVIPAPGGPAVIAVVERPYANAIRQEIALSSNGRTPGQNSFTVTAFGPTDSTISNQLPNPPLLMSDISREMIEAFPGVAMQPASAYVQNKYGPFGYAIGEAGGGELCFYGWQRLRAPDFSSTVFSGQGTLSIRLRLCDRGASEETLLGVMYGYTITASFDSASWDPYGMPVGPDEALGRVGAPTYPLGAGGFVTVVDDSPQGPAPVAAARPAPAAATRAPAELARPPLVDVVVPPPPAVPAGEDATRTPAPATRAAEPAPPGGPPPAGRALVPPPPNTDDANAGD
jgi:hypothetical protein